MSVTVISGKTKRANNYFKPLGSNVVYLFDATDTKSIEAAWAAVCAAAVSPARVSVLKPFPIAGPWWGAHLIGCSLVAAPRDDESRAEAEERTRQIRMWNDTRAYLL